MATATQKYLVSAEWIATVRGCYRLVQRADAGETLNAVEQMQLARATDITRRYFLDGKPRPKTKRTRFY
jgi:hypothetical protein